MLTFRTGAAGAPTSAAAMAAYLTEATVPTQEAQLAAYYAQDRGTEEGLILGMGTVPMPRQDVDPLLASALGIEADRPLTVAEFAFLLQGRRTDGEEWPGAARPTTYEPKRDENGEALGKQRHAIAYIDLTFSAPKSVSVAWAFAPEAERQAIAEAHRAARDETLAYMEREIAKATLGHGRSGASESGRLAWVSCDHYTSRPTVEIVRPDPLTGTAATELYAVPGSHEVAGDPQLHSHNIVPNLLLTDSGRLVAIDLRLMRHRVHEFGAVYQAFLAQNLRDVGMEARLDERTLMACMPSVPREVAESFSKRSRDSAAAARERAKRDGLDWDAMDGAARVRWLKASAHATRKPKAAELADVFSWRAQAEALGFKPETFQSYGPPEAVADGERLRRSYEASLPMFAAELVKSAVLDGSDARLAAARGLIEHGIKGTEDIDAVTRLMVREGVEQDGARTRLLWGVANDGRVRLTTALHKEQEEELIALGQAAARDKKLALSLSQISAAIARSPLDFSTEHGQAQRAAIEQVGQQGGLAVMIGAAGVGKTASAAVLVDAWKAQGFKVYGTALAWRQARALEEAGIGRESTRAIDPFLKAVHAGRIVLDDRSVIVLDELGQIGTRQLLDLLRLRAESGAKLVAMGDDKQCQSIEAGPVIELLRKALGAEAIPEIYTTVRQQTEREQEIAGMFRRGEVAQAIAAKRRDGTAELVEGGYHEAVNRVAALYREQREAAPGMSLTISAPTNHDAREISKAVREARRAMGEVGRDQVAVAASDGRGDDYLLRLAVGDRVRLFQRTSATFAPGRVANIGDNGSILTVEAIVPGEGLRLRAESGRAGFVAWRDLRHRGSDRVALTYGDALTIDTSQGITSDIHIHAIPGGSAAVSGFKNYVAATRHRVRSLLVGSMGAELRGAVASRPLGLPEPKGGAAHDEAWAHVVRNLSRTSPKESALAMLAALTASRRRATRALQAGLRAQEARMRHGVRSLLGQRLRQGGQARAVERAAPRVAEAVEARARAVEQAAPFPALDKLLAELTPQFTVLGQLVGEGKLGYRDTLDDLIALRVLPACRQDGRLEARFDDVIDAVSSKLAAAAAAKLAPAPKEGPRLSA